MKAAKIGAFVAGLAVLGGFGYGVWAWREGSLSLPFLAEPQAEPLADGTPVKLLLLQQITSGGTPKGEEIPVIVAEEVKDSRGRIAIPLGATGLIEVVQSRGATAVTQLVNQPARLGIQFLSVTDTQGRVIPLRAQAAPGADPLELTRDSTGSRDLSDAALKLKDNEELQRSWESVQKALENRGAGSLQAPDLRKALQDVASEMDMPATMQSLDDNRPWADLGNALDQARKGDLSGLSGPDAMIALTALKELGGLLGTADKTLRGVFKGRNITAPVGLELTAYVDKGRISSEK